MKITAIHLTFSDGRLNRVVDAEFEFASGASTRIKLPDLTDDQPDYDDNIRKVVEDCESDLRELIRTEPGLAQSPD
jgi:hypothetical protein